MILVDTSVWIDHFRRGEPELQDILVKDRLLMHPAIIGELALGSLRDRKNVLALLAAQRQIVTAKHDDVLSIIDRFQLYNMGIGYTDGHILASIVLNEHASLWTRDKRLIVAANKAGVAVYLPIATER